MTPTKAVDRRSTAGADVRAQPAHDRGDDRGEPSQRITHPDKVLFPADGITKAELAAYYAHVAPVMLPHLRGRPVTLERFPTGIGDKGFMQKSVTRGRPAWLPIVEVPKKDGVVYHPLVDDARALAWMANQNCITPHVWNRRVPDLARPDLFMVDLDPMRDDAAMLRTAALAVRDVLAARGLPSWVKTTGSKGFHVVVPLRDTVGGTSGSDAVWRLAEEVATALMAREPALFTREFHKRERGERILIDMGRNGWGATFAATYAVRPRAGAPVSAPCTWDEIASGAVGPQTFTLRTMGARLDAVGDLWAELHAHAVAL